MYPKSLDRAVVLILAVAVIFNPQLLFAVGSSGFENASYSARSLGQANAVVARPQDPDTVAFNPAGIPDLKGAQVSGNLEGLHTFTWHKSSVTHNTEKSANLLVLIPTGYATYNLGERFDNRVGVGLGFNFPFGVSNRYPSQSEMARYAGYKNSIKLGALTLATGAKLNDKISVGGAAVYYRIFQYDQIFNYPNTAVLGSGQDGLINTYQHGGAWGWTASALLKPIEYHNIGVYYRSHANIRTNGRATVTGLISGNLQGFDTFPTWESGIHSDVQLPSNITVGYAYIPSEKWSYEVDLGWTGWSVFADQDISVDRPNAVTQALGRIPRNYHNTWSINTGGHYKLNEKLDWLGGMWLYPAASPKENFDAVIPDSNRLGLSTGFTYPITKKLDFSTNVFTIFFENRSIANREHLAKNKVSNDGEYISFIYGFMSGFTYKFGEGAKEKPAKVEGAPAQAPVIRQFPKGG